MMQDMQISRGPVFCSASHAVWTGCRWELDNEGRVEKFNLRLRPVGVGQGANQ